MIDPASIFAPGPGPMFSDLSSSAYEPYHVFATRNGRFKNMVVTNKSASDRYLMLFDSPVIVGNSTVPSLYPPLWIPAKSTSSISEELAGGIEFNTGLVACLSTTEDALTLTGTNDGQFKANVQT